MNMHIFFLSFAYKIDDGLNDILFSYYLIKIF